MMTKWAGIGKKKIGTNQVWGPKGNAGKGKKLPVPTKLTYKKLKKRAW